MLSAPVGTDERDQDARLALILAAAKRHPETGAGLTAWTRSLYEPHTAREAIAALQAALPELQRQLLAVSGQRSRGRGTTSGPSRDADLPDAGGDQSARP